MRVQVTPPLLESLATVAVKGVAFSWVVEPTGMIALGGEMVTVMAKTVIPTELDLVASETAVATMVTGRLLATGEEGAV